MEVNQSQFQRPKSDHRKNNPRNGDQFRPPEIQEIFKIIKKKAARKSRNLDNTTTVI
ncbi:hypothetical protein Hanom_Chr16g01431971 [Helianthus anomalus]